MGSRRALVAGPMRWFTDDADANDDDWDEVVAAYEAHLSEIVPQLPAALAALATDPRLDLHDGRFREVTVDREAQEIVMVIDCGNVQVGYRRLTLQFDRAAVVPENLYLQAAAIGAEFRSDHWHQGAWVTEIRVIEVDVLPGKRFVLRLRSWPFHEFAIEFGALSIAEEALDARGPARAGTFVVRS
jgi:hypothetical protein